MISCGPDGKPNQNRRFEIATPELIYRCYEEQDLQAYAEAYCDVFGSEMDGPLFHWKHGANIERFGAPLVYLACEADGKIAGANSFFWDEVQFEGRGYAVVQSGDSLVVPSHRGRGLFTSILDYAFKDLSTRGCAAIIGFANENSIRGFVKQGYTRISGITGIEKDQRYSAAIKAIPGAKRIGSLLKSKRPDPDSSSSRLSVQEREPSDDGILSFLENTPRDGIFVRKSLGDLRRKYRDKPKENYEFYELRADEERVAAFIVRRRRIRAGLSVGVIMESVAAGTADMGACLDALVAELAGRAYARISTWKAGDERHHEPWLAHGFVAKPLPLHFIVKMVDPENHEFMLAPELWNLGPGDADTA